MDRSPTYLISLLGLLLAGCAQHVTLTPVYQPSLNTRNHFEHCAYNIEVADARKRTSVYQKTLSHEDAKKWLLGSLAHLAPTEVAPATTGSPPVLLTLQKAYVSHLATTKSSTVVIAAKQGNTHAYYRGRATNINWWGTADEYQEALNCALENALDQFAKDGRFSITCTPKKDLVTQGL